MFNPLRSTSCPGAALEAYAAFVTPVNVRNWDIYSLSLNLRMEMVTSFPFILSVFQQVLTQLAFVKFTY